MSVIITNSFYLAGVKAAIESDSFTAATLLLRKKLIAWDMWDVMNDCYVEDSKYIVAKDAFMRGFEDELNGKSLGER